MSALPLMNDYGFKFKRTLEEGIHLAGRRLGEFRREFHLDELLSESLHDDDGAKEVAAKALVALYLTDDGRFNRCTIALKAVMVYLHEEASDSPEIETDRRA